MQKAGGDPSKVTFVEMPFPDMPAQLAAGKVDAAWESEPFRSQILAAGGSVLFDNLTETYPKLQIATYFTSEKLKAEDPATVAAFVEGMNESLAYATAHPDEARAVLSTYTKIPPEVAAKVVLPAWPAELDAQSATAVGEAARSFGTLTKAPDVAGLFAGRLTGRPAERQQMLEVRGLRKVYTSRDRTVEALRDITFSVAAGRAGVPGRALRAAARRRCCKCLAGLLGPTAGEVRVEGRPVSGPPPGMAVVFQEYGRSLFPWMSVAQNVELPLRHKGRGRAERGAGSWREALAAVGLAHTPDAYPWQLSGGMQQRVAIARALAYEPHVMLMDEPFAAVDAQTRADLEDLIRTLWDRTGVTTLFVTHDIDEAVYLGERVVVLSSSPTVVQDDLPVDLPRRAGPARHPGAAALHRAAQPRVRRDPVGAAGRGPGGRRMSAVTAGPRVPRRPCSGRPAWRSPPRPRRCCRGCSGVPGDVLPPLSAILGALADEVPTPQFRQALPRPCVQWGLGLAVAVVLGVAVGRRARLGAVAAPVHGLHGRVPAADPLRGARAAGRPACSAPSCGRRCCSSSTPRSGRCSCRRMYGVADVDPVAEQTARSYGLGRLGAGASRALAERAAVRRDRRAAGRRASP